MLAATLDELRTVAIAAEDASGYFPAMYARVTDRIRRAAADGRFDDGDKMMRFARAFADLYLRPRRGEVAAPGCWEAAWSVSGDRRLLIVQHLLLGMNAHINHDLPLVVVQLADEHDGIDPLRVDFDAVNAVLSETMPDVLGDLGRVSRWVNLAAAIGGGSAFNFSLRAARTQAWRTAQRQHRLGAEERRRDTVALDELVRVLAYLITKPAWPARWLVPIGRLLEDDDAPRVTKGLLGPLA